MKFNENQLKVLKHKDKPCMVVASAGSGKTVTSIQRVKKLIESGVSPQRIAMLTFSNKSAKDLKKKASDLFLEDITIGTFHSICGKVLLQKGINTVNKIKPFEVENIFKKVDKDFKIKEIDKIRNFIGYQKNNAIKYNEEFIGEIDTVPEELVRECYKKYEEYKKNKKLYDWEDVLLLAYEELAKEDNTYTFDYLLIDEAQDNNLIQNMIIDKLCPSKNIMLIGDFRQSIYSFRGSNSKLFMNFPNQYDDVSVINMNINYRSCNNIVEKSNNFIKKYYRNYEHYIDAIANNKENGSIKYANSCDKEDECIKIVDDIQAKLESGVEPNEIAILYRNNANSSSIENELKLRKINYFVNSTEGSFFNRKEIKFVMAILRLIQNPNDDGAYEIAFNSRFYPFTFLKKSILDDMIDLSAKKNISMFESSDLIKVQQQWQRKSLNEFRDIINNLISQNKNKVELGIIINNIIRIFKMKKYIEENCNEEDIDDKLEALDSLFKFVRNNTIDSFIKFVYQSDNSKKKCKKDDIQLMTIHKSKGLEFDNVYLVGIQNGKFPSDRADIIDEANLFYVAVTRPKKNLVISEIGIGDYFVEEYFNKQIK